VYAGKPIIGIAGGIGSGKSFIASLFGQEGCLVLSADDQVRALYNDPEIKQTLRHWWGDGVFNTLGEIDRRAVARRIFNNPDEKKRLESLLHPRVQHLRDQAMQAASKDSQVLAFVWDIPLLFEIGHHTSCDAIVFVEAPLEQRLVRVRQTRGWNEAELLARENLQLPLDNKRRMSNYILQNTADVGFAERQVRDVLSQILATCSSNRPQANPPASPAGPSAVSQDQHPPDDSRARHG
jgi:dephospho-CoA kinase